MPILHGTAGIMRGRQCSGMQKNTPDLQRDTAAEMKARYDLTKGTVLIHNDIESLTKEVWKLQPYEAYMIELLQ